MAFDPNNFVGQRPDGRYDVYVDGKYYGDFADQGMAEQQYNFSKAGSTTSNTNTTAKAPGAWSGNMNVGGGSEWYNQAGDLANSAANQQYLRDRLAQIDRPAFDLQRFLGQSGVTGYYTSGGTPMSEDAALDYIWSHWNGLPQLAAGAGHNVSTPEAQRAFLRNNWLPSNRQGKSISEVAAEFGAPVGGMSAAAGGDGALPTFDREKWNEDNRQWNTARSDQNRQFYTNFLGSKSGPRDWAVYQALRPSGAFGEVTSSPSWEQSLVDYMRAPQAAGTSQSNTGTAENYYIGAATPAAQQWAAQQWAARGADAPRMQQATNQSATNQSAQWWKPTSNANTTFGQVTQPASIRPQDWYKKGTAGQEMQAGTWAAQGIDPEDAQRMMRAAWPTGSAPVQTVYR